MKFQKMLFKTFITFNTASNGFYTVQKVISYDHPSTWGRAMLHLKDILANFGNKFLDMSF